jgi:hypothetical protein
MAQKLFIGGLSFSTSTERLREVFTQAEAAVKKFNGQELDGRTLKVELAKPAGSGGGARGGGSNRSRW